jgi:hypothetical protein
MSPMFMMIFTIFISPNEIIFILLEEGIFLRDFHNVLFLSYFVVYSLYLLTDIHKARSQCFCFPNL